MLVAVVSDTHGNREGMRRLAMQLREMGVSTVLHLGDDYRDADTLELFGFEVLAVPGAFCPEYADPKIPNRRVVELVGVKMFLSHTPQRHRLDLPEDPNPQDPPPEVRLVLFGHTHQPLLEMRENILWLNPGHLLEREDRGQAPTFALLDLTPQRVAVEIRGLRHGTLVDKMERPLTVRA